MRHDRGFTGAKPQRKKTGEHNCVGCGVGLSKTRINEGKHRCVVCQEKADKERRQAF